jgi:hypothetical protein
MSILFDHAYTILTFNCIASCQQSYGLHPRPTTSSTHHDMMNVPEELREFMIAGTPKEAVAYTQYQAHYAADQEMLVEEEEEVDEENDDSK